MLIRRRLAPALLALAVPVAFPAACTETKVTSGPICTTEARPSVTASVVDGAGLPLGGATVVWSVDGGPEQAAECADPLATPDSCSRFVAGWEQQGRIAVRASKEGLAAADATVDVAMDEDRCHVVTQEVTLALLPAADR